jgi:tetratricopeptide (TPR) repeat protein
MRNAHWLLLPILLPPLAAQVSLHDLPALARSRAERLRPAQEKALEPFWADLRLAFHDNAEYLDQRIAQVATLGDSVVPLLLEKLQPVADSAQARNLAGNCRRVLERLDPGSFLDALVELARSSNGVARVEAVQLLGQSRSPRAVPVLAAMLDEHRGGETLFILDALVKLRDPSVAGLLVPMLGSTDRAVRTAVMDYLVAAAPASVMPTVLQSLSTEADRSLLPKYVEYLAATARADGAAAKALLPLLDREKLDWRGTKRLVEVLAQIAPPDHEPTTRRLHDLLDTGETGALALQAASTLRALGDKNGLKKLMSTINDQLKRPQRRQDPQLYEDRANLHFAMGEYRDAAEDFDKVLDLTNSLMLQRKIRRELVRCEAHRNRWDRALKHLKESGMSFDDVQALGREDEAVQEALQRPSIRSWLQGLQRGESDH